MNQAFNYEIRRRAYPENYNLADLALFDLLLGSLLQEFTFAGAKTSSWLIVVGVVMLNTALGH